MVKTTKNLNQKTGKEIIGIYEKLEKQGVKPEDAVFFLMIHMDKMKAKEIVMDMSDSNGNNRRIIVAIETDDVPPAPIKSTTSMVA
jgi:hypothetical protein